MLIVLFLPPAANLKPNAFHHTLSRAPYALRHSQRSMLFPMLYALCPLSKIDFLNFWIIANLFRCAFSHQFSPIEYNDAIGVVEYHIHP
jgi:hypothetical protein